MDRELDEVNVNDWLILASQDIDWWTGVDCDVFISCLDSHSDGTHSLQRIHWWASDVMLYTFLQIWGRNKIIYILDGLRLIFISGWTIVLNM